MLVGPCPLVFVHSHFLSACLNIWNDVHAKYPAPLESIEVVFPSQNIKRGGIEPAGTVVEGWSDSDLQINSLEAPKTLGVDDLFQHLPVHYCNLRREILVQVHNDLDFLDTTLPVHRNTVKHVRHPLEVVPELVHRPVVPVNPASGPA